VSAVFEARSVVAGYGKREVLRGVDLAVGAGELWAVLGPNGAGKSTLVRVGMGLLAPWRGGAFVLGRSARAFERRAFAREVAWVPQSEAPGSGFTALELVLMGRAPHQGAWGLPSARDVEAARAALEELGASQIADRPLSRLSGGERRLAFLARAFAQEPRLLWLDEPTAFLDLRHQIEALERVRERTRRGMAAIAVLHDVNLAAAFATRVLLLKGGEVLAAGPTGDVLTSSALEGLFDVRMASAEAAGQRLLAPRLAR
jgi:iron complex transport system ATP-binding protein